MPLRRVFWLLALPAFLLSLSLVRLCVRLYTDYLWFGEVGFRPIFLTILSTQLVLGLVTGVGTAAILYLCFMLADRLTSAAAPVVLADLAGMLNWPVQSLKIRRTALAISAFIGLVLGMDASERWQSYLLYQNGVPFHEADRIFGRDLGFYVFDLPFLSVIRSYLLVLLIAISAGTVLVYLVRGHIVPVPRHLRMSPVARTHLSVLAILFVFLLGFHFYLSSCNLVHSTSGVVAGVSYADREALLPALRSLLYFVCPLAVILLVVGLFRRDNRFAYAAFGSIAFAYIGGYLYFGLIQKVVVAPNEIVKETPYIAVNMAYTRKAYNLDNIEERTLAAEAGLTSEAIQRNSATINNIRLWDHAPLLDTYSQLQEIRTYYTFASVDNDRYNINGEYRQVMLSARELSYEHLPNRSWMNERMSYTHGFGLALGPVNRITPEGLPEFFVKDIPPVVTVPSLQIKRPEIYYGEVGSAYVLVNTQAKEFDYPSGDDNVYTAYSGTGGVPISSVLRRILFASRFGSKDLLLSSLITPQSRVMYYRNIMERLRRIAPFLRYDSDQYLVISEGRLKWICDAYTITSDYPYSQPISQVGNYIRNSVKAVVDAYDGSVTLYVADPEDPIIRTFASVFPGCFAPLASMSLDLRQHLRYPQDLFSVQASMYSKYHMTEPQVFYNQEDLWEVPLRAGGDGVMEPYYTIMRPPGGQREEFILMLPFTPRRKDNLSAWMCARNDSPEYGRLVVYLFPKAKVVYGPRQISSRINQDPEISRQLSLWDQRGSQVSHGTLLVIPIEESLIYVQPLYLKAETGQIPELRRVIVAYENEIAMEETLEKAIARIFRDRASSASVPAGAEAPEVASQQRIAVLETSGEAAAQALGHYERAQKLLRDGDWAGYGQEMEALGRVLKEMKKE